MTTAIAAATVTIEATTTTAGTIVTTIETGMTLTTGMTGMTAMTGTTVMIGTTTAATTGAAMTPAAMVAILGTAVTVTTVAMIMIVAAAVAGTTGGAATTTEPGSGTERVGISPADFLAWREGWVFAEIGAYVPFGTLDWTGGEEPVRLSRHLVSEGLLAALRVRPALGRLFTKEEYGAGGARVALLSDRLWRTRFCSRLRLRSLAICRRVAPADSNP